MEIGWVFEECVEWLLRLLVVEFVVPQHGRHHRWIGLLGEVAAVTCLWCERVGTMVEHALGQTARVGVGLDAEVAEHRVGFPASEKLDDVCVDACAEERRGATRAQGASRQVFKRYACRWVFEASSPAKSVSDELGLDAVPFSVLRVVVVVSVDRCVGLCAPAEESSGDAA